MKFFAGLAALASLAAAAPSGAPTPLDVKLEMAGNSMVKATITNTGKQNLKVFKVGTILDKIPTEKVKITSGGKDVDFEGVRLRLSEDDINDSHFHKIAAGQSVEVTFDAAESHDLTSGGQFDIVSSGILQFANEDENKLVGSVPYVSQTLSATVNGAEAAAVRSATRASHEKRTTLQSDCTGDRLSTTKQVLKNCVSLSNNAADAATNGPAAKMEEYYKSSSSSVRSQVAKVFKNVAAECGNTPGGVSKYYCTDVQGHCDAGPILAYTVPSQSYEAYCDIYWDKLPVLTSRCHRQDMSTTTLHEMTHLRQVAGTKDLGYGYDKLSKLNTKDALNNADTYAMFANAIYAQC